MKLTNAQQRFMLQFGPNKDNIEIFPREKQTAISLEKMGLIKIHKSIGDIHLEAEYLYNFPLEIIGIVQQDRNGFFDVGNMYDAIHSLAYKKVKITIEVIT